MSNQELREILVYEMKRRHANLKRELDSLIDELQTARKRLENDKPSVSRLTANLTYTAGEVLRLATELAVYQEIHAQATKAGINPAP